MPMDKDDTVHIHFQVYVKHLHKLITNESQKPNKFWRIFYWTHFLTTKQQS